jgi:hypothetical protein
MTSGSRLEADKSSMAQPSSSTTTISTVAIQSKQTRIVVALLKSGKRLDLKVSIF